jgi:hypothetical protein
MGAVPRAHSVSKWVCQGDVKLAGCGGRGIMVTGDSDDYHGDPVSCHVLVLEHLVENGMNHVAIKLSQHEAHGSRIQTCGESVRDEYRFLL